MRVRVVCMRQRGVPVERRRLNHTATAEGELYVEEHADKALGRTLRVARLASPSPTDAPLLPPLTDVQLLWCGNRGFVLCGFERLGSADYAQAWWCRVD